MTFPDKETIAAASWAQTASQATTDQQLAAAQLIGGIATFLGEPVPQNLGDSMEVVSELGDPALHIYHPDAFVLQLVGHELHQHGHHTTLYLAGQPGVICKASRDTAFLHFGLFQLRMGQIPWIQEIITRQREENAAGIARLTQPRRRRRLGLW